MPLFEPLNSFRSIVEHSSVDFVASSMELQVHVLSSIDQEKNSVKWNL